MGTMNVVLLSMAGVFLVLYLLRRRARLRSEDSFGGGCAKPPRTGRVRAQRRVERLHGRSWRLARGPVRPTRRIRCQLRWTERRRQRLAARLYPTSPTRVGDGDASLEDAWCDDRKLGST